MQGNEERIRDVEREGVVYSFPCPECGHKFDVMVDLDFKILRGKRRRRRPEVCDALSYKEWQRFGRLTTEQKIIFGIGKFKDVKGKSPSISDLENFIGFSRQTISPIVHRHPQLISIKEQKRGDKMRFAPACLELTEMGYSAYLHAVDLLLE